MPAHEYITKPTLYDINLPEHLQLNIVDIDFNIDLSYRSSCGAR